MPPLLFALLAVASAACDVCTSLETYSQPIRQVVLPPGGSTGDFGGCVCEWIFAYSAGATTGRLTVDASAGLGVVSVYGAADDDAALIAVLDEPDALDGATVYSSTGVLRVRFQSEAATGTLVLDVSAINAAPIFFLDGSEFIPATLNADALAIPWDEAPYFPLIIEDHDNFDQGVTVQVILLASGDQETVVLVNPPATSGVTFTFGTPGVFSRGFGLDGPLSAVSTALSRTRLIASSLSLLSSEFLFTSVSDQGHSGEGGEQVIEYTMTVVTKAAGIVEVDAATDDVFTTGFDFLADNDFLAFRLFNVREISFSFFDLEVRDRGDQSEPCYDYVRIYDGVDEDGVIISTELSPLGDLCAFLGTPVPDYRSLTGTLYIELRTDAAFTSQGLEGIMTPTPGRFSVSFLSQDLGALSAASNVPLLLPPMVVFDLPAGIETIALQVRACALVGMVRVAFADSFPDLINAENQPEGCVLLSHTETAEPVILRLSKALEVLEYVAPPGETGQDQITVDAFAAGQQAAPLIFNVTVVNVGINVESSSIATNAFARTSLGISVTADPTVSDFELTLSASLGQFSTDSRTTRDVVVGYVSELTLVGSVSDLNDALESVVYRASEAGSDTVELSLGGTVRTLNVDVDAQCSDSRRIYGARGNFTDRIGPFAVRYPADTVCQWSLVGPTRFSFSELDISELSSLRVWVVQNGFFVVAYQHVSGQAPPSVIISEEGSTLVEFAALGGVARGFVLEYEASFDGTDPAVVVVPNVPPTYLLGSPAPIPQLYVRHFVLPGTRLVVELTADEGTLSVDPAAVAALSESAVLQTDEEGVVVIIGMFEDVDRVLSNVYFAPPDSNGEVDLTLTATDELDNFRGWIFQVDVIPCEGLLEIHLDPRRETSTQVSDGSGVSNYTPFLSCQWLLTGATAPAVLDFEFLTLEAFSTGEGCYDAVEIFDGSNAEGRSLGVFCAPSQLEAAGTIVATTGSFFLSLTSDETVQNNGFLATYRTLPSARLDSLGDAPETGDPVRVGETTVVLPTEPSGTVVVVGGDNGIRSVLSVIAFDTSTAQWLSLPSVLAPGASEVPARRKYASGADVDASRMVLFGGLDDADETLGDTWIASLVDDGEQVAWAPIETGDLPPASFGAPMLRIESTLYLLVEGGSLWALDTAFLAWSRLSVGGGAQPGSLGGAVGAVFGSSIVTRSASGAYWQLDVDPARRQSQGDWAQIVPTTPVTSEACTVVDAKQPCSALAIRDELLIVGDGVVQALNVSDGVWTLISDAAPTEPLSGGPGVFLDRDAAYIFSGGAMQVLTLTVDVGSASPLVSPVGGGTVLEVAGTHLSDCLDPRCVFVSSDEAEIGVTAGLVRTGRVLECPTPTAPAAAAAETALTAAVSVQCGADGAPMAIAEDLWYFEGPVVTKVEPLEPRVLETFSATIEGLPTEAIGFVEQPLCMFDDVFVVTAALSEDGQIACAVPEDVTATTTSLRVSLDGQQFGAGSFTLTVTQADGDMVSGSDSSLVVIVAVVAAVLLLLGLVGFLRYRAMALYRIAAMAAPWQIKFEQLELSDLIGTGSFGNVYKGLFRGSDVAIKMIKASEITVASITAFRAEADLMAELRHPHIVLFMGASTLPPNVAIVLEFLENGALYDLIHNPDFYYETPEIFRMALEIAKGMSYLHEAEPPILHRDLKSLNVLVTKTFTLKVSDFGLTEVFDQGVGKHAGEQPLGSIYWSAPEVLRGEQFVTESDVYSFAVTVWEIVTRRNPYSMPPPTVAMRVISSGLRPSMDDGDFDPEIRRIIEQSWSQDYKKRPTFKDVREQLQDLYRVHDQKSSTLGSNTLEMGRPAGGASVPMGNDLCICVLAVTDATMLWDAGPAWMRSALRVFSTEVAQVCKEHNAYVVSSDKSSSVVAFESVAGGMRFALHLQKALAQASWAPWDYGTPPEALSEVKGLFRGLRVAMGIHFGGVSRARDPLTGRILFEGEMVDMAGALCSLAAGGQILVPTGHSSALDADDLGYSAHSIGEQSLRGGGHMELTAAYPTELRGRHERVSLRHMDVGSSAQVGKAKEQPQWIINESELLVGKLIGSGSYGSVYRGTWNGTPVACKMLYRKKLGNEESLDLQMEVGVASSLRHPNVCQFLGLCHMDGGNKTYIVSELVERGSLHDAVVVTPNKIEWGTRMLIIHGIAQGIGYLHTRRPPMVHRDLKAKNVLVGKDWSVKISDFGLARVKADNATMTKVGTAASLAPEQLRGERYDESVDVYALGILMWEVGTQSVAYSDRANNNLSMLMQAVIDGARPDPAKIKEQPDYVALMCECWDADPSKRPQMVQVVSRMGEIIEKMPASLVGVKKRQRSSVHTVTGGFMRRLSIVTGVGRRRSTQVMEVEED